MIRKLTIPMLLLGAAGGCGNICIIEGEGCSAFNWCTGVHLDGCLANDDCGTWLDPCQGVAVCEDCVCVWREPTCDECPDQPLCQMNDE